MKLDSRYLEAQIRLQHLTELCDVGPANLPVPSCSIGVALPCAAAGLSGRLCVNTWDEVIGILSPLNKC